MYDLHFLCRNFSSVLLRFPRKCFSSHALNVVDLCCRQKEYCTVLYNVSTCLGQGGTGGKGGDGAPAIRCELLTVNFGKVELFSGVGGNGGTGGAGGNGGTGGYAHQWGAYCGAPGNGGSGGYGGNGGQGGNNQIVGCKIVKSAIAEVIEISNSNNVGKGGSGGYGGSIGTKGGKDRNNFPPNGTPVDRSTLIAAAGISGNVIIDKANCPF